jgi:hypothetical protein
MSQNLKFDDSVWYRVVQIVQEALLMNVDCVDLLRMIRVQVEESSGDLVLTEEYQKQVENMHNKWLETAVNLQAQANASNVKTVKPIKETVN